MFQEICKFWTQIPEKMTVFCHCQHHTKICCMITIFFFHSCSQHSIQTANSIIFSCLCSAAHLQGFQWQGTNWRETSSLFILCRGFTNSGRRPHITQFEIDCKSTSIFGTACQFLAKKWYNFWNVFKRISWTFWQGHFSPFPVSLSASAETIELTLRNVKSGHLLRQEVNRTL